jgi:glycosyl transferase, family 25
MDNGAHYVAVIGLPRRPERRAAIEATLRRLPALTPLFAADIGAVVDWRDWSPDQIEGLRGRAFPWCDSRAVNPWWNRHLKLGEIACTLSHWNVWSVALARQLDHIIVLEDDASLEPRFDEVTGMLAQLSALDPQWDFLYLGRGRPQPDRGRRGGFVLPGFSTCMHGYVVSSRGLTKLLRTGLPDAVIPVDEFLPAMYMEHPRRDVRARFPPTLAAYGLEQDVVRQRPKAACGSDTEDSPFLVPA